MPLGSDERWLHLIINSEGRSIAFPSSGLDFTGSATNLQLGRVNSGPSGAGTVIRGEAFSGAISGSTIVGTVSRSFNFTTSTSNPGEIHVESYPNSGASVTLTRP